MLFVVIGFGLAALFFELGFHKYWDTGLIVFLVAFSLLGGIITPFCIDLGYNEKQLETKVQLVSLGTDVTSVGTGNKRYVTISGEKIYTCRYEVENTTELEGSMYKTATISGNVQEIESEACKTPMLYVYVEKTKNSWWFSANTQDRHTYVFYVPEGTIIRNITLD